MPIKYQMLGGGGSGLTVAINTGVGSTVTLSNEKYNKTLIANNNGLAVFENLKVGTYNVKVVADGGLTDQMAIQVTGNQTEQVAFKVKELQLGSKIKFSSGKKFLLSGKDVKGHATNSATLWSEYIIENYEFRRDGTSGTETDNRNGCAYIDSTVHKKLMPKYYNELNDAEKSALLEYRAKTYDSENGGFDYTNSFFWLPSDSELDREGNYTKDKEGKNIYLKMYEHLYDFVNVTSDNDFTDNWMRQKTLEGEKIPKPYFTRSNEYYSDVGFWRAGLVRVDGYILVENLPGVAGIVPACDISQDAFVTLGDDGYYRIIADRFLGKLAKDLPLKSKIKLSSGKTFILRAKNASGHEDDTVTLMSEYIVENAKWSNGIERVPYSSSDVRTKTLQGYYNELTTNEKLSFVPYGEHGDIWLMAESDASSLKLSVQGDRIMKFSNGKTGDWMTRDYRDTVGEQTQDGEPQDGVIKYKRDSFQSATVVWTGGKFAQGVNIYEGVEVSYSNDPTWRAESGAYTEYGVVPFFDLNGNTKLEKGADGYWRIIG